ncbi:SigE family RNA polymerase sigma factor [Myceligenerans cantabricum]
MSGTATAAENGGTGRDVEVVRSHADPVAAFTAFARDSTPALYRIAYLLCGDPHRAHDLVQLALERTYKAWRRVKDGDPFAYARRAVATARIDTWRRTRREVVSDDPAGGGGPTAPSSELEIAERDRLVRALMALPVKQRRVVVLRFLLDRSEKETAAELGLSAGTVKSTASRALARLRTLVAPEPGQEGRS